MVRVPAFQAGYASSILVTRSILRIAVGLSLLTAGVGIGARSAFAAAAPSASAAPADASAEQCHTLAFVGDSVSYYMENNLHVRIGKDDFFLSADGHLMPTRKDQPPPDLRYFTQPRK